MNRAIRIKSLVLSETGTYNPIHERAYNTHVDGVALDILGNRLEQSGPGDITADLMSGIASSMVSPDAVAGKVVDIAQGWSERRLRFVMEVEVDISGASQAIYYFQGYTNDLGVSNSGHIDPRMEFTINSYLRVKRISMMGAAGMELRDVVAESGHIVNGGKIVDYADPTDPFVMRPQDIFMGIQSTHLENSYSYFGQGGLEDTRVRLREPIISDRSNNIPSRYMSSILGAFKTGRGLEEWGQSNEDVLNHCKHLVQENTLYENKFFRAMADVSGYSMGVRFTYEDLASLDPNTGNVTNYLRLGNTAANTMHSEGQSSYWNGSDRETVVATILTNAVPALMMELFLNKVVFSTTNHTAGMNAETVIMHGESITQADLSYNFDKFKNRLEKEVLYDITAGNQELYSITMDVNLFGETSITLSMDGGAEITFVTPSFCDSLTAPITTADNYNFHRTVQDFESMMNNVSPSHPNPY